MGTQERNTSLKKPYIKPEVSRVALDNSITLVMMTPGPPNPPPRGKPPRPSGDSFASPFEDKPFE